MRLALTILTSQAQLPTQHARLKRQVTLQSRENDMLSVALVREHIKIPVTSLLTPKIYLWGPHEVQRFRFKYRTRDRLN